MAKNLEFTDVHRTVTQCDLFPRPRDRSALKVQRVFKRSLTKASANLLGFLTTAVLYTISKAYRYGPYLSPLTSLEAYLFIGLHAL